VNSDEVSQTKAIFSGFSRIILENGDIYEGQTLNG
jgi:hypothetical protein